ncbi:MAG: hypothetical protein NZ518_00915, partial [Dehalococcoidia bacterium]|nr:hypothetical protein [Dehalococcoidia bacterium]
SDTLVVGAITVPSLVEELPGAAVGRAMGDAITLATAETEGSCLSGVVPCHLTVRLGWRVTARPADDYTVFVHLAGPDNRPIATGDSPPAQGRYPTSWWSPGERIVDAHALTAPASAPPGEYRVLVGLYRPSDGARLPIAGVPPGDGLEIARFTLGGR